MIKILYYSFALFVFFFSNILIAEPKLSSLPHVTFYAESYPPANYMENSKLVGITVDTLKLMWADQEMSQQNISLVPWERGYREVLKTPNTALITTSRTLGREHLFKWVGPVFKAVHVLMAKKDAHLKFTTLGDVLDYRVATVHGDISEIFLQQIGFSDFNMAKVTDIERAFLMMQSGRVDMMMISVHGFQYLTKLLKVDPAKYERVWHVNQIGNYIAFNIETPDEVIESYQQAFENVSAQRLLIKQKYNLSKALY